MTKPEMTTPEIHCSHDKLVHPDKLLPNPKNPNQHPDSQIALLATIIEKQGWRAPIVVSKLSGLVVAGHGRLQAAQRLGLKKVPVNYQEFASAEAETAHMLADNQLAELSEMNDTALLALLKGLEGNEASEWTGFDAAAILALVDSETTPTEVDAEPQIDKSDELKKKWGVETGQVWILDQHRIICGNSTSKDDVGRLMGDDKATLVFTDPPYGVAIGEKNRMLNSFQPSGRNLTDIVSDQMSAKDLKEMLLNCFTLTKKFMTDDCAVFVCSPQGGELGMMMMMMMMEAGLEIRHVLNWVKNSPTFSMGRLDYDYAHEPILYTWNKTHKRKKEGQFQSSVWTVDKPRSSKEHPTMKPVELPENAILNHTDAGDICYEPFSGSGTMIIACERTARQCRAVEISTGYVAVALQRWADATGKTPVLQ